MKEIWKDIKGYEGLYQISNLGRVKSLTHISTNNHIMKGKILKYRKTKNGRIQIGLYKNGKQSQKYLSRLVAETFISNPNNLPEVNHKDENIENNCIDNLEWCDSKYNSNYGTRTKRIVQSNLQNGTYEKNRKTQSKCVAKYDINNNLICVYKNILEASKLNNLNNNLIGKHIKTGNLYHNFYWRLYEKAL